MIEAISLSIQSKGTIDQKIESEKAKIKKLEKDAVKISNAFIDATPAMRSRLNMQLEDIEKKINECKQAIIKLENHSTDEEVLRKRLLAIEKQLSGWIDVSKESLDRTMVEKLISKITIHMDGQVDVAVVFGNIKRYQFTVDSNKKLITDIPQIEIPSGQIIRDNIRKAFREVASEETEKVSIDVVSFQGSKHGGVPSNVVVSLEAK